MAQTVSIVIPAYERTDSLRNTLSVLRSHVDSDTEVIVVDDHSNSDEIRVVCSEFEFPKYYRTDQNMGVIGARNFGYSLCSGDIIINFDDDSFPTTFNFIDRVRTLFDENSIGIAAFNIDQDQSTKWSPDRDRFDTYTYTGCGNAWSRKLYDQIGAFSPLFWRQGEELEHSMRAIESGFRIIAAPDIVVKHVPSQINRHPRIHQALELSNYLKRVVLRVPKMFLPEYIARFITLLIIRRKSYDSSALFSDLRSQRGLASAISQRHPISSQAFKQWADLRDASK